MTDVILKEQRQVTDLVLRNKDKGEKDLQRQVGDAAALYRAALVAVEQARAAPTEEVNLGAWLAMFPATGVRPPTAYLAGDDRPVDPLTGRPERVSYRRERSAMSSEICFGTGVRPARPDRQTSTVWVLSSGRRRGV
jgi:hypothetical protein